MEHKKTPTSQLKQKGEIIDKASPSSRILDDAGNDEILQRIKRARELVSGVSRYNVQIPIKKIRIEDYDTYFKTKIAKINTNASDIEKNNIFESLNRKELENKEKTLKNDRFQLKINEDKANTLEDTHIIISKSLDKDKNFDSGKIFQVPNNSPLNALNANKEALDKNFPKFNQTIFGGLSSNASNPITSSSFKGFQPFSSNSFPFGKSSQESLLNPNPFNTKSSFETQAPAQNALNPLLFSQNPLFEKLNNPEKAPTPIKSPLFEPSKNINLETTKPGLFSGSNFFSADSTQKNELISISSSKLIPESQLNNNEALKPKELPTSNQSLFSNQIFNKQEKPLEMPISAIIPKYPSLEPTKNINPEIAKFGFLPAPLSENSFKFFSGPHSINNDAIQKPEATTNSQSLFTTGNTKKQESSLEKPISSVFGPPKDDNIVKPKPGSFFENSIKLLSGPELKNNEAIPKVELTTSNQSLFSTDNVKKQEISLGKPISSVFEPPKGDNIVKPKPGSFFENSIKLFSGPELKHNEIIPKPELPTSNQSINSIGMQEKPASLFDRTHNLNMEIAKSGLFSGSSLFSKNVNQKQGSLFENPSVPSAENQLKTNESIQNKESPTIDNIKKTDMSLEKPQSSIIPQSLLFNQPISSTPLFSSLFNQSSGSQKPENSPIKQSSLFGNIPQQSGGLFSSSSTNLFPSTLFGNTSAG